MTTNDNTNDNIIFIDDHVYNGEYSITRVVTDIETRFEIRFKNIISSDSEVIFFSGSRQKLFICYLARQSDSSYHWEFYYD